MFFDARAPMRFWDKVLTCPMSGCWLWVGAMMSNGYGSLTVGSKPLGTKRSVLAHRFSYETLVGEIGPGLQLDHICRVRSCVNPAHLEPVTMAENLRRSPLSNMNAVRCPRGHLYDERNTYHRPNGYRNCRACSRSGGRDVLSKFSRRGVSHAS